MHQAPAVLQVSQSLTLAMKMIRLYQMFVTYDCDGYSTAPLTQYRNNEI